MGRFPIRYELVRDRTLGEARKLERATKTSQRYGGALGEAATTLLESMWGLAMSDAESIAAYLAWGAAAPPTFWDRSAQLSRAVLDHYDDEPPELNLRVRASFFTSRSLAELTGCAERSVALSLKRLEQHGFVHRLQAQT